MSAMTENEKLEHVFNLVNKLDNDLNNIVESFNKAIEERDVVINKLENEVDELRKKLRKKESKIQRDVEAVDNVSDDNAIITISTRRENGGEIKMSMKVVQKPNETEENAYLRTYYLLLQTINKTLA